MAVLTSMRGNEMQDEVMNDLHEVYTDPNPEDLVRVTRCKNCRYGDDRKDTKVVICKLYIEKHLKFPTDYCSEGLEKDV